MFQVSGAFAYSSKAPIRGKKRRNLTGKVEKKKISGRIPQNFKFLAVFLVSGAFAYSSQAHIRPSCLSIRM